MIWTPHVTVAAIAERDGRFLIVEEEISGDTVLNQPAGHLDAGETLLQAVQREALEETAWRFAPQAVTGFYLWTHPGSGITYFRVAFCGHCLAQEDRPLDAGVRQVLWLSRTELLARSSELRSPMVLMAVDDYLAGRRYPLSMLIHLGSPPRD
jgi:8-oxo-dGTP pyrophosphatase MutT (NUDIX family)